MAEQPMGNEAETHAQDQETQGVNFIQFVFSLAHTAAFHFGDVPDESGQKLTPNLPAAQQIIDILAMVEEKTRGNLTAEERQFLDQLLFELRMRYVEIEKGGAPAPPQSRIIIP